MKWIRWVLLKIQSRHDSVHRWTDRQIDKVKPVYPLSTSTSFATCLYILENNVCVRLLLYLRGLQYCETFITERNDISSAQATLKSLIPCPGLPSKETSQATTTSTKDHLEFSHSNNSYTLHSNKCRGATTLKDEPCSSCQYISTNFQQTTTDESIQKHHCTKLPGEGLSVPWNFNIKKQHHWKEK